MMLYHLMYDLVSYGLVPVRYLENGPMTALAMLCAGVFIVVAGLCCRFSGSNLRRGLLVCAAALVVTLVTWAFGTPVWWGILHFMGTAMLLYAAAGRLVERLPEWTMWLWLGFGLALMPILFVTVETPHLWVLGLRTADFISADYFPLMPWMFVFLFGAVLGGRVKRGDMPAWVYELSCPPLERLGRHSLLVYLLHQPLLMGVTYVLYRLLG